MPKTPTGTLTQKTSRQSMAASIPPSTRPMNEPAMAAIMLMPERHAALVRGEGVGQDGGGVGHQEAPPTPWITRKTISSMAPAGPVLHVSDSRIEASREDGETQVVHPDPAEDVAEPSEASRPGRP